MGNRTSGGRSLARATFGLAALAFVPAAIAACSSGGNDADFAGTTNGLEAAPLPTKPFPRPTICTRAAAGTVKTLAQKGDVATTDLGKKVIKFPPIFVPTIPAGSPSWVDKCSLTKYIARTNDDTCRKVTTLRGSWTGASAFPGVSSGVCKYAWTPIAGGSAFPTAADYNALDAIIPRAPQGTFFASADCPPPDAPPPECGTPSTSPALPTPDPNPHIDGGIPQGLTSCDSCVTSGDSQLFVNLDPKWAAAQTIYAVDPAVDHYVAFEPANALLFTVPVPPGTFTPGEHVILLKSRFDPPL